MDKIMILKIWNDEVLDFCELLLSVKEKNISVETTFYSSNKQLMELYQKLKDMYNLKISEFVWKEDNNVLKFEMIDKLGHIRIELNLQIDKDYTQNHYCQLYVNDLSLEDLNTLSKKILDLTK